MSFRVHGDKGWSAVFPRLRCQHNASEQASMQVCARLGLVSLAYLWRQPQARLLRDMWQAGVHAVLVKVAAIGLRRD